jgi:chemotaxis protein MotB
VVSKKGNGQGGNIIIKREEIIEGGHHGGAWKVAYADFVTAMMAFFLLMWLLNATTEKQRRGLADYFAPSNAIATKTSGSGLPFGGRTPFDNGSMVSDKGAQTVKPGRSTAAVAPDDADADMSDQALAPRQIDDDGDPAPAQLARSNADDSGEDGGSKKMQSPQTEPNADDRAATADKAREERAQRVAQERANFDQAAEQMRAALQADPDLAAFAHQLSIDITPEGLRIQLLDEDRQPMFASGSTVLNDRARLIVQKIAPMIAKLPEPISITGHTDAEPYHGGGMTNWDLSTERANATRRLLAESGLADQRFKSVAGTADRDLLLPGDPRAAANRRIVIVVLRQIPASGRDTPAAAERPAAVSPTPNPARAAAGEGGDAAAPRGTVGPSGASPQATGTGVAAPAGGARTQPASPPRKSPQSPVTGAQPGARAP